MNIILIMIPLSLLLLVGAGVMFFWAVNKGQFDDMDSPALSPVSDNLPEEELGDEEKAAQELQQVDCEQSRSEKITKEDNH